MAVLLVIPARYDSSRYPGKPLAELRGATGKAQSLIHRTWDVAKAVSGIDRVVVATDDDRIEAHCTGFGAEVIMTDPACENGTARCSDALARLGGGYDTVVNLQGDAPLTPPRFITALLTAMAEGASMATPVLRCDAAALTGFLEDRAAGRVGGTTAVFDANGHALYFSKEVIPYIGRNYEVGEETPVFHHVGVYAYSAEALAAYRGWAPGPLEQNEGLEQLRFLENGMPVTCVEVTAAEAGFWELNNPADIPRIEAILAARGTA